MSLTVQFYTILSMIMMGSWLGIALDTYGRFLKRPKRAHWLIIINDLFFWVVQGLIIFYVLLRVNNGEFRFYIILALLCGFAAYQSLIQSLYKKFLEKIIYIAVSFYQFMYNLVRNLVIKPIILLLKLLLASVIMIGKGLISIFFILLKILLAPIKWIGFLTWRMLPKKIKYFFIKQVRIFSDIKNMVKKWVKKFRR